MDFLSKFACIFGTEVLLNLFVPYAPVIETRRSLEKLKCQNTVLLLWLQNTFNRILSFPKNILTVTPWNCRFWYKYLRFSFVLLNNSSTGRVVWAFYSNRRQGWIDLTIVHGACTVHSPKYYFYCQHNSKKLIIKHS